MRKSCRTCSAALEAQTLDPTSAQSGPLTLKVTGMPILKCAKGHQQPVGNDFMLWLIHALKEREATLPAGNEQGMLMFKKYSCGACGKELAAKPERRQAFPFELAYEGVPAFQAELEVPLYKCPACGKEQLHSRKAVQGITAQAVAALNDAARFPHSA